MSSNYPAGVTDAHPHFNPNEHSLTVHCNNEEAQVVPSFAVKAALIELADLAVEKKWTLERQRLLIQRITELQGNIDEWDREGDYECQWTGEMEVPVSEEARWDCPRCGVEQSTDTLPEEDPDRGWDDRDDD